jgi:DNA polymerase-1
MSKEKIYLIDGSSICYRSFFAIRLSTSWGFPTGAIYGFFQTLKKIMSKYNPEYIGICFDVSRKTFRQDKFKEYKIKRPPLPDALKTQIPIIKKLIKYLGISIIEKEGFEADDIIATLVERAIRDNLSVVIVSSDKDIYQLLDDKKVVIYNPNQEKIIGEKEFISEFGFSPPLIIDYLSLVGDSVDNIPGAKGIGKVTASQLVKDFGTIENIFECLDKIPSKVKNILLENKENIFLSKELVKLSSCDLELNWHNLKIKSPSYQEIYKLFHQLEFKKLIKEIPAPSLDLKLEIKKESPCNILKENKTPLILSISNSQVYISLNKHIYQVPIDEVKYFIEDEKIKKVSYDFKEQLVELEDNIEMRGIWFDVKIAGYLLDPSFPDYSLSSLISYYLGQFTSTIPKETEPYFIRELYNLFYQKIKDEGLEKLFFEVEMPLIYVLNDMQRWGVKIDMEVMDNLLKEVDKKLLEAKEEIFKLAGKEFNLNSPQQLRKILFEELKIPPLRKTKTGYSTDESVLEKLAKDYPIARFLLEYRQLNKLKSTYILPLIDEVKNHQGRLHAKFNQTATQTGRLSCSSPNLQSIPTKGEFSLFLRKAFIPSFNPGYLLSADYSQIELRILAHFSKEEKLMEAFKENRDIHRYTASILFRIKEEEVNAQQRDLAKRVNFGIIYGMSSYGLAHQLNISQEMAESFIESYFYRYPKVKDYIENICKEAETKGYVKTILGRKRNLPDLKSPNHQLREFARRQAINTPIQGSCADLIKLAMVNIFNELKRRKLKTKLLIQIHDELLFDVPKQELEEVIKIVKRNMEESIKLEVPIKVNLKVGKNWAQMQEIGG